MSKILFGFVRLPSMAPLKPRLHPDVQPRAADARAGEIFATELRRPYLLIKFVNLHIDNVN